ncbi:hypothetical protein H6G33_09760 [Calothrix sp. FACHB-1219]|uniref:hypothetical protein n=1 Tax=unclassified Calothrix TaxID=2619626 RepID=UPI0016822BAD|nr:MULTISPECIES: hypothetical protein [unclassified Calothrix]MBD2201632.1 hypothetical protein [Calothrix sp. FACHB-168]MBD2217318.1 hypothetical protein [Calothrix sp. FACHB-1219]
MVPEIMSETLDPTIGILRGTRAVNEVEWEGDILVHLKKKVIFRYIPVDRPIRKRKRRNYDYVSSGNLDYSSLTID